MAISSAHHAPSIPGLTYKGMLGSGGFADVYLYQSTRPLRDVAVKVLHDKALSDQLIRRFAEEADTMAALEHPYIVRVYSSGLTQDGRPYIEMAYYPDMTLAQAVAKGPLPVPEVLRIGVQLASAVEAAHQVGLLHRDIKPANVLIDKYMDPALTDFGVASHLHEADDMEASLSVPWAPPEAMFATSSLDRRGDVYSLAATLWHLLVGHAPFEVPGGDNKPNAMMVRVRDLPAPSTGRGDVPASLERLLRQGMSKEPRMRPATAQDFARALNVIEEELRLRPTPFKVARQVDRTTRVSPFATPQEGTRVRSPLATTDEDGTRIRGAVVKQANGEATQIRVGAGLNEEVQKSEPEPEPRVSRSSIIVGVIILFVVAVCLTAWVIFAPLSPSGIDTELPTPTIGPDDGHGYAGIPIVSGVIEGDQVTFTWTYEYENAGDFYFVDGPDKTVRVDVKSYTVDYAGEEVCISVRVSRVDGTYVHPEGGRGCAP